MSGFPVVGGVLGQEGSCTPDRLPPLHPTWEPRPLMILGQSIVIQALSLGASHWHLLALLSERIGHMFLQAEQGTQGKFRLQAVPMEQPEALSIHR